MGLIFTHPGRLSPNWKCAFFDIFFVILWGILLADISELVTLRQNLKQADPNYFSFLGLQIQNVHFMSFLGDFLANKK